jgi:tRNA(Ile)-lysidine synthase
MPDPSDHLIGILHRQLADHPPAASLGVAVSGGPDSLALLLLAHAARPGQVHAATVDHGLRPESAAEADKVASLCAAHGIPHATLRAEWAPAPRLGLQAQARAHRYRLLEIWCDSNAIPLLMTAHHRDDQAETLLMRLARGSGLAGLAGVRARRPLAPGATVMLLRPLLDVAKADLVAFVAARGLVAVDDPSNHDPRHDRSHARALLAATPWLDPNRLAASARHLADAETALAWSTARESAKRIRRIDDRTTILDPEDLPPELLRRLVLLCLQRDPSAQPPRGMDVNQLISLLNFGSVATLAGFVARPVAGLWHFEPAPPRRPTRNPL